MVHLRSDRNAMILKRFVIVFLIAVVGTALWPKASYAELPQPAGHHTSQEGTIVIKGVVKSINGNKWVVGTETIEISSTTTITGYPVIGSPVSIIVVRGPNNTLVAQSVVLITVTITNGTPAATGTASATSVATATSQATAPANATVSATTSVNGVQFVAIIIDGPVEQIDLTVNIIVVFGQRIRFRKDEPVRMKMKVGDWVHVEGDFDHDENNQIIIVAIVIIIIDTPPVIVIAPAPSGGGGGGGHHDDDD